jgi:ribosomal protein S18 acetylase RimI-like enzyme
VTNFYVTPEQRDHGVGGALLDEVTRYARDHRLDTLVVWPSERSASLYRRCGFDGPGELLELPVTPG